MAGNTNHYSLPYPTAGDPIYLGASQIQASMDAVDAALWTAGIPAVAQTNPPRCGAARTTLQSIPNSTDTLVAFNYKNYDSEAVRIPAAPMYVAGNNFVTIRVAGIYNVESNVVMTAAGGVRNSRILLNGTGINNSLVTSPAVGGGEESMLLTSTYQFAVGDILRVMVWQNSGGAVNLYGPTSAASWYTRLTVTYLGPATA